MVVIPSPTAYAFSIYSPSGLALFTLLVLRTTAKYDDRLLLPYLPTLF